MNLIKKRILTGDRPTGRLHLGNYFGSLINRVKYQDEYECFFMIADFHMLTTDYDRSLELKSKVYDIVIDWISVGIDFNKATFFLQSKVPAHSFLHLIFSMLVTVPRLERIPTLKDKVKESRFQDEYSYTYGLLGYPVLQAADILAYRADVVPVGEDQLSHIELTREIARRFNYLYGDTFPEPQAMMSEVSRVPGIDGLNNKMSKSLDNELSLSHSSEEITSRVMSMVTDPSRIRASDLGHPDICTAFCFYKIFVPSEQLEDIRKECENGKIGCVSCKKRLSVIINDWLNPIREKRRELEKNLAYVKDILFEGTKKATEESSKTVELVKERMGINIF